MKTWAEAITSYRNVRVRDPSRVPSRSYGKGYYHAYAERDPATDIPIHMHPAYVLGYMHGKEDRQREYWATMMTDSI
jgi:hypothetical protein